VRVSPVSVFKNLHLPSLVPIRLSRWRVPDTIGRHLVVQCFGCLGSTPPGPEGCRLKPIAVCSCDIANKILGRSDAVWIECHSGLLGEQRGRLVIQPIDETTGGQSFRPDPNRCHGQRSNYTASGLRKQAGEPNRVGWLSDFAVLVKSFLPLCSHLLTFFECLKSP